MADIIDNSVIPATGVAYPYAVVRAVINATWNEAITKQAAFDAKLANLLNTSSGFLADEQKPVIGAATTAEASVDEPVVTLPATVDSDAIIGQFDSKYADIVTLLSDHYAGFIGNYFPSDSTLFADAVAWLSDAIANPDDALPAAVRDAMIEEVRAKVDAERQRSTTQLFDEFAARGFPLPSGALAAATSDLQAKGLTEISAGARAMMIKNFELAYEKVKFAIGAALDTRKAALDAAVGYIGALATAPDTAAQALNIGYDAQSKLIAAVSQFYGARTNAKELLLKSRQFNASQTQSADMKNADTDLAFLGERVKALTTEAQALAQMTTSLFNNLHVSSGTSASAGYSESKEII